MHAMRVSYSLYRVYSEGKWGNETTEVQGERRKEDGRRLRYIGEEGRKKKEEEASCQLSVSSTATMPKQEELACSSPN